MDSEHNDLKNNKKMYIQKLLQRRVIETGNQNNSNTNSHHLLSYAQKGLWYTYQVIKNKSIYNIGISIEINGNLDSDILNKTFDDIYRRHDILRSNYFVDIDRKLVQSVHKYQPYHIKRIDLTQLDSKKDKIDEIKRDIFENDFDLENDELFRIVLIQITEQSYDLAICMHHIISDGWSVGVFVNELVTLYDSLSNKSMEKIPDLTVQYGDLSDAESSYFESEFGKKQIDYWKNQLQGVTLVRMNQNGNPDRIGTDQTEKLQVKLPNDLFEKLQSFSAKHCVSTNVVLLSMINVLLYRFTGQKDICVGVPFAHRNDDTFHMIGYFVNVLPIRVLVNTDNTIETFIKDVEHHIKEAFANSDIPLARIIEEVNPERSSNNNGIFNILYSYESLSEISDGSEIMKREDLQFVLHEKQEYDAKFDLDIYPIEQKDGLVINFIYHTQEFYPMLMKKLIESFSLVLSAFLDKSELQISQLQIVSSEDLKIINDQFNDTYKYYDKNKTIIDYFQDSVKLYHNHVAVKYKDQSLCYQELNQRVNELSWHMIENGVKPNDIVGLYLDRSIEMIISVLAILKVGATYLPISPYYPIERTMFILDETKVNTILTDEEYYEQVKKYMESVEQDNVINVNDESLYQGKCTNPDIKIRPDSIAYIIYTSGTTGRPKGVKIRHYSLANRLLWMQDKYPLCSEDVILQKTTYTFDVSVWELLLWTLSGASVALLPQGEEKNPKQMIEYIQSYRISVMHFVPSMMNAFLDYLVIDHSKRDFSSLRQVFCSGEALTHDLVNKFNASMDSHICLSNLYGPTEATIDVTYYDCPKNHLQKLIPIGKPISNTRLYITDSDYNLQPIGVIGELCIAGDGVAEGYIMRDDLNKKKFITQQLNRDIMYTTGDLAYYLEDGNIAYLGRKDNQVKIRGFRIELSEIEEVLAKMAGINQAIVTVVGNNEKKMCAIYSATMSISIDDVKAHLRTYLPEYMIPSHYKQVKNIPCDSNGKVNRKAISFTEDLEDKEEKNFLEQTKIEKDISDAWCLVLETDHVGENKNFFDIGGNSISIIQVYKILKEKYELELEDLFSYPSVKKLARYLDISCEKEAQNHETVNRYNYERADIAVIGISCRFPGASNQYEFWDNLVHKKESVTEFSDDQLREAGISEELLADKNYVKSKAVLDGTEYFDNEFFDINPLEAQILDPQERLFLECVWQALEDAGYAKEGYPYPVGIYAGSSYSTNLLNIYKEQIMSGIVKYDPFEVALGNKPDFLATRAAYKFNLHGPAVNIQTACSTSLVSIHYACESILQGDCYMALAGGVSISVPEKQGYLYKSDGILSKDGHCRAFDQNSSGTIVGDGIGVVVLKKLCDAQKDKDHIYAVIKGSAINNDGNEKVSYTAPSSRMQEEVINTAYRKANIDKDSIQYIEMHGTGTELGDLIEIKALKNVFQDRTNHEKIMLGTVKTNIGHLDAAAGVAGFIKTVLMLHNKTIVPMVNFTKPNPKLGIENSIFEIINASEVWNSSGLPRRAGVSSFGIGGTNAHVVLEEYMEKNDRERTSGNVNVILSAKSNHSLRSIQKELYSFIKNNQNIRLDDIAYTTAIGRKGYRYRKYFNCNSLDQLLDKLSIEADGIDCFQKNSSPSYRFMFPGLGEHYVNMSRGLYEHFDLFRKYMDQCFSIMETKFNLNLKEVLYRDGDKKNLEEMFKSVMRQGSAAKNLDTKEQRVVFVHSSIFAIEYSLAKMYMDLGMVPDAMVGYSLGEYTAACISEVMDLETALNIIVNRALLIEKTSGNGRMVAVPLPYADVKKIMSDSVYISAVNSNSSCIVSGKKEDIKEWLASCEDKKIPCIVLHSEYAFHTVLLGEIKEKLYQLLEKCDLHEPKIPFISNVSGDWIKKEEACNPKYWCDHMCKTVQMDKGLHNFIHDFDGSLVEIGPGQLMSSYATPLTIEFNHPLSIYQTMPSQYANINEEQFLNNSLGKMWISGAEIHWDVLYKNTTAVKISLPTYQFEKTCFQVESLRTQNDFVPENIEQSKLMKKKSNLDDWLYIPNWKRTLLPNAKVDDRNKKVYLLFADSFGIYQQIIKEISDYYSKIIVVNRGFGFSHSREDEFTIRGDQKEDYVELFTALNQSNIQIDAIVHLYNLCTYPKVTDDIIREEKNNAFFSLIYIAQAYKEIYFEQELSIYVIVNGMVRIAEEKNIDPLKSLIVGPCKVIQQENKNINVKCLDITLTEDKVDQGLIHDVITEILSERKEDIVVYRNHKRFVQYFEKIDLPKIPRQQMVLKENGVYVIVGGLGGIGFVLCKYIAGFTHMNLVIIQRSTTLSEEKRKLKQQLEAEGCNVEICSVDITNHANLEKTIEYIYEKYDHINGVIHSAGISGNGLIVSKEDSKAEKVFEAKIQGTYYLLDSLRGKVQDFIILCSSLTGVIGNIGQVDYTSANAFLNVIAQEESNRFGIPIISIAWDTWSEVGMAVDIKNNQYLQDLHELNMKVALNNQEGIEIFERILGNYQSSDIVIVSTRDLNYLDQLSKERVSQNIYENLLKREQSLKRHKRPNILTPYAEVTNELERMVRENWINLLNISEIGVNDNFFSDLGGNSLIAIRLVGAFKDAFGVNVSIKDLFEKPTIKEQSILIATMLAEFMND